MRYRSTTTDEGEQPEAADAEAGLARPLTSDPAAVKRGGRLEQLGDFNITPRALTITAAAVPVGLAGALLAWVLLRLIGLITNAVFYSRLNTHLVAPGGGLHRPLVILLAPVAGGLIVGLLARFGSERIRGHGMPEAIESILVGESRVQPRVAALKPISAAIAIGTGGPFGAEGPIIMTAGAAGSILAQALHLTADERKTLLVAGAAAGMAATFNAPLASVLLAVELLLFEWRPRSFVPVAAAVAAATLARWGLLGSGAIFALPEIHAHVSLTANVLCVVSGITGGLLAVVATALVYTSEDLFNRLPLHWMWWPAIGGLIIGLGGLVEPRALGVGYDVIGQLLSGRAGLSLIVGILIVKTLIWGLSLGSGTSGGVLAPTFMIGAAMGALEAHVLPTALPGFWALAGLAAVLGGVMRSPFTGVVFPLELTGRWPLILPMMIATASAYVLSTLLLKRSVLTEKIARRGLHLTREYSIDPLEVMLVRDVMRPLPEPGGPAASGDVLEVAPEMTLRELANRFAVCGAQRARVVQEEAPLGEIQLIDLLEARLRDYREEFHRERVLRPLPRGFGRRSLDRAARGGDRRSGSPPSA
jgi:CIC family chloride channel protein